MLCLKHALWRYFEYGLSRVLLKNSGSHLFCYIQIVAFDYFVSLSANFQFPLDLCLYSLLLLAINRFKDSDAGIFVVTDD